MISDACKAKLRELSDDKTLTDKKPDVPVTIILPEAASLYDWCLRDREALENVNLNWKLVEDLPVRIEALSHLQTVWTNEKLTTTEAQKKWKAALPPAVALKKELVRCFFFAYKDNQQAYSVTRNIAAGKDYASMIQDFLTLSELGLKYPDELKAIQFDMILLESARALSFSLSEIWAAANTDKMRSSENMLLRNKAFCHLKEAMEPIRRAGQFVFHDDKERKKGYLNVFSRQKYLASKKSKKAV